MSRSRSHGNFTDSPSRLAELEPDPPAKSFSSHGSSGPDNAAQDQVSQGPCTQSVTCPGTPMPVSSYNEMHMLCELTKTLEKSAS